MYNRVENKNEQKHIDVVVLQSMDKKDVGDTYFLSLFVCLGSCQTGKPGR